ncbi:MAG: hypothetical protein NTZ79_04075 [Proteobacteria bacterium]|nr:hypothetical protein [Pseudomonadota bacterium]
MQRIRFHHVGFPTDRPLPAREHIGTLKRTDSGYFDNPYGIEWHQFDADNELPAQIRTMPHVAFVVEDLQSALLGKEVVLAPTSPTAGVRVAFILDNHALIEFLEFDRPEELIWPHPGKFTL